MIESRIGDTIIRYEIIKNTDTDNNYREFKVIVNEYTEYNVILTSWHAKDKNDAIKQIEKNKINNDIYDMNQMTNYQG